ncbi:MAG: SIMPL domain-containing protein [Clostridiales bacterium]|nr:SIMPL domain-containing protein [Clostridiales bacterium]
MRTIKVTGKGAVKVHPDMIRITITLEGTHKDYGEALKRSSKDTETLRDLVESLGFAKTDLKTLSFDIDTKYESYEERGNYKQRFIGYEYEHEMKLEFDADNDRLGKIVYALAGSDITPEFSISYTVKDKEAVKNVLLEKSIADAKAKAAVLSNAAGVTLKDILNIDYSWGEMDLEVSLMSNCFSNRTERWSSGDGCPMNFEPDDIAVTDTVTVVWEMG